MLKHINMPKIRFYDIYYNRQDDSLVEVDTENLDEIIEMISVFQDAYIVTLEMKADIDPSKIISGILDSYKPELFNMSVDNNTWKEFRNDDKLKKRRNTLLDSLFLLTKIKFLFAYGVNVIIDNLESIHYLIDFKNDEFENFVKLEADNKIHANISIEGRYFLFKWFESFNCFSNNKKATDIFHSILYESYVNKSIQQFVEESSLEIITSIDRKTEEYKKYIAFSLININRTSHENLQKKLQPITDAIESISQINPKIKQKYVEKKRGCFAGMKYRKIQYAAISGELMQGEDKLEEILKNRYGIKLVKISNSVRYYINKNEYITYEDFIKWRTVNACDDRFLRMFSCCERKLLTICYKDKYNNHDCCMYITLEPCDMCIRAIKHLKNEKNMKFIINCIKPIKKIVKMDEADFIKVAKEIKKYKF